MNTEKPLPTSAFLKEIGIKSEKTQIKTTSYLAFEALVKEWVENHPGVKPVLVDIGAGQGINVINLEKQGLPVIAVEQVYNPRFMERKKTGICFFFRGSFRYCRSYFYQLCSKCSLKRNCRRNYS